MLGQTCPRSLKGPCGVPITYKAVLIIAFCLCVFAFIIMFEYTFEYSKTSLIVNISTQRSLVTSRNINVIRIVSKKEKKPTTKQLRAGLSKVVVSAKSVVPSRLLQPNPVQSQKTLVKQPKVHLGVKSVRTASPDAPKVYYPVTLERNYILENPHLCSSVDNLSVLIIIHTAPGNFQRRLNIRRTYANATYFQPLGNLRVLFLLGQVKVSSVQDKILTEFRQYGDLLQGEFIDAYRNLTHKGVMAYKWIKERCRNAKVILKADDDVIVNTYQLFTDYLPEFQKRSKSIFCNHIYPGTMLIIRDKKSKWYVKENEFKGQKFYPRYCSGFFVMITNDIIPAIYKSAFTTPFFWVDDVYLYGLLPAKVGGVTYTGLKKGTFQLAPMATLKCYRNTTRVCNYFVTGASRPEHVNEIWKHMTEQYLRRIAANKVVATTSPQVEYATTVGKRTEPKPREQIDKDYGVMRLQNVHPHENKYKVS